MEGSSFRYGSTYKPKVYTGLLRSFFKNDYHPPSTILHQQDRTKILGVETNILSKYSRVKLAPCGKASFTSQSKTKTLKLVVTDNQIIRL